MAKQGKREITGGCLCGAVRYRVTGDPIGTAYCHCSKCRRFHGHYPAYASLHRNHLDIVKGNTLKWYRSITDETPDVHRGFCSECGASLFWDPRGQDRIAVSLGSMDDPQDLAPSAHLWTSQKGRYYRITDDLPQHEKSIFQKS